MHRMVAHPLSIVGPLVLLLGCASTEPGAMLAGQQRAVPVATLGVQTRAPTKQEVEELGLAFAVRARGQVVTEVENDGAAARAGVQPGDVLVKLDAVELFSRDDIDDFLRASRPGQRVEALVSRGTGAKDEAVTISLGTMATTAPAQPVLAWQFASLGQLGDALAVAKVERRLVLVGLSGAET